MKSSDQKREAEARPPCCPREMEPERGDAAPLAGREVDLPGGKAYVSEPPADTPVRAAVLVFHDIFGFASGRTHHICDELARAGFLAVAPDLFRDARLADPKELVSPRFFSRAAQLVRRGRMAWALVERILREEVLPFVRRIAPEKTRLAGLGFCWGGWAVVRAGGLGIIECGVGAHPSLLNQALQSEGPTMDEMCLQCKVPILFAPGWSDPPSVRDNGHYVKLLRQANPASRSVLFERQMHGFANRSDLSVPANLEDHHKFMTLTLDFLNEHITDKSETS